ncbi:MAG: NAD(+) synthase [Bacteroidales bacterium]|nr:NAD(+) synthase [Bacteroidales bacterium]
MEPKQIKIAVGIPKVSVADCRYNGDAIVGMFGKAAAEGADVLLLPELCISGCSCGVLFEQELLLRKAQEVLADIAAHTASTTTTLVVGLPMSRPEGGYDNCVATICNGEITHLFRTTGGDVVVGGTKCHIVVGCQQAETDAAVVLHLCAETACAGHEEALREEVSKRSASCIYALASCGFGESTTDVVYPGEAMVFDHGKCVADAVPFSFEEQLVVAECRVTGNAVVNKYPPICSIHAAYDCITPTPFLPQPERIGAWCEEAVNIQVAGLAKRLLHTRAQKVVVGISGGLDSTLALLVSVRTFDKMGYRRQQIIGITMPGFGTSDRTYRNAMTLMKALGVTIREISIRKACLQHYADIGHDIGTHDVTYENAQARERTQILMDVANQEGALVVGTGDLSELALGWATYNGDHMSNYSVNASIPKTMMQHIVGQIASDSDDLTVRYTLNDIVATPISPELTPTDEQGNIRQQTESLVGPYELHDFFIWHLVRNKHCPRHIYQLATQVFGSRYSNDTIKHWLTVFCRRFFTQQFKRSCMPDGPQATPVSLSPRCGWHMPSDASAAAWIREANDLNS